MLVRRGRHDAPVYVKDSERRRTGLLDPLRAVAQVSEWKSGVSLSKDRSPGM